MRTTTPPRPLRPTTALVVAIALLLALAAALTPTAATAAAATSASPTAPTGATQTWTIKPATSAGPDTRAHLVLDAAPGATLADTVAVTNYGESPLALRLYASDAFTPADGGFDLLPGARPSTDVGAWVRLATSTVEVAPRETVLVPITITVPADASPGDHAAGIVAALVSSATDGAGQQVAVEHRVGTRVYLRVDGPLDPSLEITDLRPRHLGTLDPISPGRVEVDFTVTNRGNLRLSGSPTVTVTGPAGIELGRVLLPDLPELLPGASIEQHAELDGTWPTLRLWSQVEVRPIDPSGQVTPETVSRSAALWAVPWGQLLVVVLLAGATAVAIRRRRGRGRGTPVPASGQATDVAHAPGGSAGTDTAAR